MVRYCVAVASSTNVNVVLDCSSLYCSKERDPIDHFRGRESEAKREKVPGLRFQFPISNSKHVFFPSSFLLQAFEWIFSRKRKGRNGNLQEQARRAGNKKTEKAKAQEA